MHIIPTNRPLSDLCGAGLDIRHHGGDVQMVVAEGMAEAVPGFLMDQFGAVGALPVVGDVIVAGHFGEAPQAAPDAGGRALLQQPFAVGVAQHQQLDGFYGLVFFGLLAGVVGLVALMEGAAAVHQRAAVAIGFAAGADHRAEIHHRLGVVLAALVGGELFGNVPQLVQYRGGAGPAVHGEVASQYPFDVAVEDGGFLSHGEAGDGAGGGAADARQGRQLFNTGREFTPKVGDNHLGALVQVAGAGVVAEAGPQVQHVVLRGGGQILNRGVVHHKTFEIRDDGRHLGLLQHNLGHPHAVRRHTLLPGQVLATVQVKPVEYAL